MNTYVKSYNEFLFERASTIIDGKGNEITVTTNQQTNVQENITCFLLNNYANYKMFIDENIDKDNQIVKSFNNDTDKAIATFYLQNPAWHASFKNQINAIENFFSEQNTNKNIGDYVWVQHNTGSNSVIDLVNKYANMMHPRTKDIWQKADIYGVLNDSQIDTTTYVNPTNLRMYFDSLVNNFIVLPLSLKKVDSNATVHLPSDNIIDFKYDNIKNITLINKSPRCVSISFEANNKQHILNIRSHSHDCSVTAEFSGEGSNRGQGGKCMSMLNALANVNQRCNLVSDLPEKDLLVNKDLCKKFKSFTNLTRITNYVELLTGNNAFDFNVDNKDVWVKICNTFAKINKCINDGNTLECVLFELYKSSKGINNGALKFYELQ